MQQLLGIPIYETTLIKLEIAIYGQNNLIYPSSKELWESLKKKEP
jgi:hypothetical protein